MLKVGVFGVGHLGKFHLNNWKEIEGVELIGFYDPNEKTAKAVEEKYDLKHFDTVDALLNKIDGPLYFDYIKSCTDVMVKQLPPFIEHCDDAKNLHCDRIEQIQRRKQTCLCHHHTSPRTIRDMRRFHHLR